MDTKAGQPDEMKVDRSSFSVGRLTDPDDSLSYWLSRRVEERLQAVELLRRTFYGDSYAAARLQRSLEIARLTPVLPLK